MNDAIESMKAKCVELSIGLGKEHCNRSVTFSELFEIIVAGKGDDMSERSAEYFLRQIKELKQKVDMLESKAGTDNLKPRVKEKFDELERRVAEIEKALSWGLSCARCMKDDVSVRSQDLVRVLEEMVVVKPSSECNNKVNCPKCGHKYAECSCKTMEFETVKTTIEIDRKHTEAWLKAYHQSNTIELQIAALEEIVKDIEGKLS